MRILISAGPTRERIDAVRFLSNRSTGKMGYALAEAARSSGMETVLVSGPVALKPPAGVRVIAVESAAEMAEAIRAEESAADVIIMAAAVADYRPVKRLDGKMKKSTGNLTLELERTEDILAGLGERKTPGKILVGFAAETEDLLAYAESKLERKNLDWIAANDVSRSDIGFGSDSNQVVLLGRNGAKVQLGPAPKREIAEQLLQIILKKRNREYAI